LALSIFLQSLYAIDCEGFINMIEV
jgi:hypothetical protein